MTAVHRNRCGAYAALMLMCTTVLATPALADDTAEEIFDPATSPVDGSLLAESNRVFTFADFERFAPRTAFDMVTRIPGFGRKRHMSVGRLP